VTVNSLLVLFGLDEKVSEDLMLASPESQDSDMMTHFPPWKLLTDFILQKNADYRSYQQLVNIRIHKRLKKILLFLLKKLSNLVALKF